jgi:hypothetical protein
LAAEVSRRLTQLDLILDQCRGALSRLENPKRDQKTLAWVRKAQPRFARGELTEEEYMAGFPVPTREESLALVRAFDEVHLLTEIFYVIAWRLREILNGPSPRDFPLLREVKATAIRVVRNHLIEHPEHRPSPDYTQSLIITDDGPALKSTTFVIRGNPPRAGVSEEDPDRGLFVNAEAFYRELDAVFIDAST